LALAVALRSRAYLAALAAAFAGEFVLIGARSAMVPLYVRDVLHRPPGWAYAAFLIVSVVSGALLLPVGKLADTVGRRPVIGVGLVVGAFGFALLPTVPAIAGLVAAMALIGVASASDSVAPGAVMGDVVAGRGGTVVAFFQMAGDVGAVTGPVVAGLLVDGASYPVAFGLAGGVLAAAALLALMTPECHNDRDTSA
jgi:MFS family permease